MGLETIALSTLAVGGGGLKAIGQFQSANISEKSGEIDALSSEWNAVLSEYEGDRIKKKADIEESILREDINRTVGTATAITGGSGFAFEGSGEDAIDDIVRSGEIDAALVRYQGDIGQWEKQQEAVGYRLGGQAAKARGEAQGYQDRLSGVGTLLSTVGRVAPYIKGGGN